MPRELKYFITISYNHLYPKSEEHQPYFNTLEVTEIVIKKKAYFSKKYIGM
tara:strand:- start:195 stop:347 length:153 start_codon:yes stop_codon:yes gene_type:complete